MTLPSLANISISLEALAPAGTFARLATWSPRVEADTTARIIAIMLGRLKMSIEECINAYISFSDTVFQKRRHRFTLRGKIQGRFDTPALERAIKQILVQHGFSEDELLRDHTDSTCKV